MDFDSKLLARAAYISYLETDLFSQHSIVALPPTWEQLPPQIQDLWLSAVNSLAGLVNPTAVIQLEETELN